MSTSHNIITIGYDAHFKRIETKGGEEASHLSSGSGASLLGLLSALDICKWGHSPCIVMHERLWALLLVFRLLLVASFVIYESKVKDVT